MIMSRSSWLATMVFVGLTMVPAAVYAQGSITGVVEDTSGGVLPGVTVEAASPVLIEQVRAVVTDGTGQYRVVDLPAGAYDVTFTLPGFAVVVREDIELTGTFTATVGAQLQVGTLEETITVTGESPVVDVQTTTTERVISREILEVIPTARNEYGLGVLIPGVTLTGGQDVGGSGGQSAFPSIQIHGSEDLVQAIGGLSISVLTTGTHQPVRVNPAALQEIVMETTGGGAEFGVGGIRINRIPKDGGNTFNGVFLSTFANNSMQGDNLSQDLIDRGLRTPNEVNLNYEWNPGFGGPIMRDKLWFYVAGMQRRSSMFPAGLFKDANFNNPNVWTYEPSNVRATNERSQDDIHVRLTWQATPRNKFAYTLHDANLCWCPQNASLRSSQEAEDAREYPIRMINTFEWTTPLTNRVLLEFGGNYIRSVSDSFPFEGTRPEMIQVTDQGTGMVYRAGAGFRHRPEWVFNVRTALSYVTGSHALSVGFTHRQGAQQEHKFEVNPLRFRFRNGVPNRLTMTGLPTEFSGNRLTVLQDLDHDIGAYVQDKWTSGRLTVNLGVRYDYFTNSFPVQFAGPTLFLPDRNITFPETLGSKFHDITPRLGAAYDVTGTGKTAVKVSVNRYVASLGSGGLRATGSSNPANNLFVSTNRSWDDANGDFVPDCDLLNPAPNGECGRWSGPFGEVGATGRGRVGRSSFGEFDRGLLEGWGRRDYNWEFSAGVQQEVAPGVAAEFGYFRRVYGNFLVTDNRAITTADFTEYSLTGPVDARLPGGGGQVFSGLYDINPDKFGQQDPFTTRASNFGDQEEYWQGVDLTINARPGAGMFLQGGMSTGRTVTDDCAVRANLDNPEQLYCRQTTNFLTQVKFLGSYTIPQLDVQFSAAFQSLPGPQIIAEEQFSSRDVQGLGRNLSGGRRANKTVDLIEPGTFYGDRIYQLDLALAKILRFGGTRLRVAADIFNALNNDAVLNENEAFGRFRQPTEILLARFVKFSVQLNF